MPGDDVGVVSGVLRNLAVEGLIDMDAQLNLSETTILGDLCGGMTFKTVISEQVRQTANYFTEVFLLDNEYITIDRSILA